MSFDSTMDENVRDLEEKVIGRRIVKVEKDADIPQGISYWSNRATVLTLDDGKRVFLVNTSDCCAYTELKSFLADPQMVDHIITGVRSENDHAVWHIFADMGDVLKLDVEWSEGSGYYGYGFEIKVLNAEDNNE